MNKCLKNSKVRVVIRNLLILLTYIAICYLINIKYDILGLFIDDLNSFMYFPNHNIFEYAFKFYDEATRYRPFYESFQYIAFFIANHNPHILYLINIIFNGFIAYYLYIKTKRMYNNKYLSLAISILYLITHFAIYQISQATGLMESIATFLSLVIFFIGIDIIKRFSLGKIAKINMLFIFISLTHERYMSLFGFLIITYIITLLYNHDSQKEVRLLICSVILSIISLTFVIFIRYLAIGRIVPAGTSGTYIVDTFSFNSLFGFMKEEFLYICGINVGNEAMGGILYRDLDILSKTIIAFHLISIIIIILAYITNFFREFKYSVKSVTEKIYIDILFVTIIILTITFSSVTVFIEKRFIVVPFIFTYMYILYMISYLYNNSKKFNKTLPIILIIIFSFSLMISRLYIENSYRKENEKIYFMVDQKRLNNLAKQTVIKYGKNIIDEKQIYIVTNSYLYTPRYLENYFVIYQSNYEKRPIKVISEMSEEEIKLIDLTKSIILAEDRGKDDYYETTFNLNQILSN